MKRTVMGLIWILTLALANAAQLSTASTEELLVLYQQLRSIQGGSQAASVENVLFKRDAATFTFLNGRIVFAEPIGGRVLAAHFRGEGKFEFEPPSQMDQHQLARFAGSGKLTDTFREAIFYFTDDTFGVMSSLMKVRSTPKAAQEPFASAQKQYAENFNGWIDSVRKGYPIMRNLSARMLADLTDASSKGFFLADFKGNKSGDLLFQISWNRDPLFFPHLASGDEVLLLRLKPGQYYEWWAGFHLSSEYEKIQHPNHRDLQVSCPTARIDLQVAKDNHISATVQMDFSVRDGPVRVLPFNLNGVLRISSMEDGTGRKLGFIQERRNLDSDPWVILAEPAKPGEKYKLKLSYKEDSTYESRIVYDRGRGNFNIGAPSGWYPSFGMYDDRTLYEINASSPKRFAFVATGLQTKSEKGNDELVTSWKPEIPVGRIGFSYGDFVQATQTTPSVQMSAYATNELPNEMQGIENANTEMSIMRGGRADAVLLRGGLNTKTMVKHAANMGVQAFSFYEFLFGKLPFKSISVVQQGEGGDGWWPNLAVVPYSALMDSTTQNNLGMHQSGEGREYLRTVAVREIAYQWWKHLITPKTYHDQWLSEGGADFAVSMYLRQFSPGEMNDFREIRRMNLLQKNQLGYRPVDAGAMWLNEQLNEYNAERNAFDVTRYKGGCIMEMLRVLMLDPSMKNPDSRFIAMMRDFTGTHAGENVSTEDFQKTVEKHAGRPMDWFFNEWVYGAETPSYEFSYHLANAEGGQTELSMSLTQSGVSESFQMALPVYQVVKGEQQFLRLIGVTGTKPAKTSIKLPARPDKILLDPERSILAEIHQ